MPLCTLTGAPFLVLGCWTIRSGYIVEAVNWLSATLGSADIQPFPALRLIPPKPLSCMCSFSVSCGFKSTLRRGRRSQNSFVVWQLAIDKQEWKTLQCQELSLPMVPVRTTTLRKETPDEIEYGEAILVALKLKAERQLEVIAPDQQDNLLMLCRLMLDIQAVQEKLSRERWRISVCRR
jgi:hypothetical protein